jgi:oligopeptide/dipeptide ABC transporter ATP-binding protein
MLAPGVTDPDEVESVTTASDDAHQGTLAPVMEVRDLVKHFQPSRTALSGSSKPVVRAVDGVSFALHQHETVALVGESGSGKSTLVKLLLGLEQPTAGEVVFRGGQLSKRRKASKTYRAEVQAVFQDPAASLDPRRKIGYSISEPVSVIHGKSKREREERVAELLELVGLPQSSADAYPHELSGGMQQRVAIARALAPWPSVLILDEPVSALDVSIKAQVMNLLKDLQQKLDLSYLIVAHDLATVRFLANKIAVMYLGRVVEYGDTEEVFTNPQHAYTQALLSASAAKRPGQKIEVSDSSLLADVGSASNLPSGCRFHPRCPWATEVCAAEDPQLILTQPGHEVACHGYRDDLFDGRPVPERITLWQ